MKTIKAGRKLYQLQNTSNFTENEVFGILKTYRAELIHSIIAIGLETYIELRFNQRIGPKQQLDLKRNLYALANSPIRTGEFTEICLSIFRFDYLVIPSAPFYHQIDERLRANLAQTEIRFRSPVKRTPTITALIRTR